MATKQHGRRAAEAKVKTPLTELTELLSTNSGVFGRRAAVVAASGGLLTAAVLPAAGQGADDTKVAVSEEATTQIEFQNQTAAVVAGADEKKDAKDKKADNAFTSTAQTVTAAPAPEPKPEPSVDADNGDSGTTDSGDAVGSDAPGSTGPGASDGSGESDSGDSGSSAGPVDGSKAEQVLAWAARGVGTPYVMGGTTQSGWDCSGFTSWVFSHVGVNLPRTSGAQKASGRVVSASEAQPGDIIWHPGHVGIYAGGGMMYDAGSPSSGTSKRSYSWMGNVTFIRVL